MKMVIKFLDNFVLISKDYVNCLEIENKNYFYRIVSNINEISNGNSSDEIVFYNDNTEIDMGNKVNLLLDYFNIDLTNKKIINSLNELISNSIDEIDKNKINKLYNDIIKIIVKNSNDIDLPIIFADQYNINNIIKSASISIKQSNDILSNLLLLFDESKVMNDNKLITFVNLKQYLTNEELLELYKYAIYNKINILLIDSQAYGIKLEYERKLIIDKDLEEFVL